MPNLKAIVGMSYEELKQEKDRVESELFYINNELKLREMFSKVYRVTAITPEEGRIEYDTMDEAIARRVHSNLMSRQLDPNDFTSGVSVSVVEGGVSRLEAQCSDYGVGK